MTPINFLASLVALSLIGYLYSRRPKGSNLPLPPGPKKLPLIGNLLDLSKDFPWVQYLRWGRKANSGIIHLDVAGSSIIVVNSHEIADDLFEKRSSKYSSRPRFRMVNELIGWTWAFGFMPYGESWRERRKLFHQQFHPTTLMRHRPHEIKATHAMLRCLLNTPDGFIEHLRHMVGVTIMSVSYGINVLSSDDPYIDTAEKALFGLSTAAMPGAFLVDSIPLLKYVPSWLPGAGFQTKAKEWREETRKMVEVPYAAVQRDIANGVAEPSFTLYCLENMDRTKDIANQERVIKETAANLYMGGSDTTVSALITFILAMVCFPGAQAKAQEELDKVLTPGHLPEFNDEDSLPYISALVKEVIRWQPVAPIGECSSLHQGDNTDSYGWLREPAIPHYLTEEDEYNGYRLPADSVVIGNTWAILHDEIVYPDPSSFKPERFLKNGKLNPEIRDPVAAFGYGRRTCPAQHMAMSSVWIAAASILATFNITKAIDEEGSIIEPTQEYHTALVCHPLPFKCSIRPRSKEAKLLILSDRNHAD